MSLASRAAGIRWLPANLFLDAIERTDAVQSFGRDRRPMADMDVMEAASGMGPTRYLVHPPIPIKTMQTGIGVRLQSACEGPQMLLRMFSSTVFRIGKPDSRRSGLRGRPIIADVSPEAPRLGLSVAGCEYRNRGVVGVYLRPRHNMPPDLLDQRCKQLMCGSRPSGKCRAIKIDAFPRKGLRLPVKRLVVAKFRDQHMCKQIGARQAVRNRPGRSRRLHDAVTTGACELGANVANDLVCCRNTLQLLGSILAELPQPSTAIGTAVVLGHVGDDSRGRSSGRGLRRGRDERRFDSLPVELGWPASAAS